jgi:aryl-alcohol dehydrogenase-like predicted oxidoreductase
MELREFGHTSVKVTPISLGSWPMSGDRYGPIDDGEAVRTIRSAFDRGITSFDTAPGYGSGHAEETLGVGLADRRSGAVIATKCGIVPTAGRGRVGRDGSRASILMEIDASLGRLGTDHVDVYLVHWPDPNTPLDETMATMADIQQAGKTRLVGVSNFDVELLERARAIHPVDVLQVGYNLFDRRMQREVFPYCAQHGIGVMAYGSLCYGLLTGAFTEETTFLDWDWRAGGIAFGQPILGGENFKQNVRVVNRLRDEVAKPKGITVAQLALAWVIRNPVVTTALVGARVPSEIEENVSATEVQLSVSDLERIDAIMADAAGQVNVFRPFGSATEVWA